jgi:GAF domain-containing protein
VIAPLLSRHEVLGALTVARTDADRPFTEDDLPPIEDLVRGLALQVDNARLGQQTRHIAERGPHQGPGQRQAEQLEMPQVLSAVVAG